MWNGIVTPVVLASFAEDDDSSLKKSELINWYLKEIESEIESEEELINKKKIIERVIHRLTHYVRKKLYGCFRLRINKYLFLMQGVHQSL